MATDDWFTCPTCGERVRDGALACPSCGADEETGWSEMTQYDELDLPDEAFGGPQRRELKQRGGWFVAVAVGLIVLLLVWSLAGVW